MKYEVITSRRKTLALQVKRDGSVIVRAPYFCSAGSIEKFVSGHREWIEKARLRQQMKEDRFSLSTDEINALRQKAQSVLPERIEHFSKLTGLTPTGIKITAAKTRFGSCSGKNRVCFSLYLFQYSDKAVDYVVLHELAHIKYKNHSKEFYGFIKRFMPDYKSYQKELRK